MAKKIVTVIIRLARMSRHAPAKFGPFIKSNKWPGEYVYQDRSFTMKEFEEGYEKILIDTHSRFGVFPVPKFVVEVIEDEPAPKEPEQIKAPETPAQPETSPPVTPPVERPPSEPETDPVAPPPAQTKPKGKRKAE